jgi:hypothetical protein
VLEQESIAFRVVAWAWCHHRAVPDVLDAKLAVHHTLHRISHRLEQEAKDQKQAATNNDLLFHPPFTREKLKDLDGELGGQHPAGDHVVQCLGEAARCSPRSRGTRTG